MANDLVTEFLSATNDGFNTARKGKIFSSRKRGGGPPTLRKANLEIGRPRCHGHALNVNQRKTEELNSK